MGKFATTVDTQISQLKERGMNMDLGDKKAKEILLDIGYYRLGFYWNPFEIDKDHNLLANTRFSDVVELYYLDTDLKHILIKAINRIEINFKTQLIYYTSIKYDKNPTWFSDKNILEKKFVDKFPIYYTKIKSVNKPIKKHHNKHPNDIYAPAWKTIEFLTFGSVITMYTSLYNKELKETISKKYNMKSIPAFENFLLTILFIRNICAHSDLLFDSNTPKEIYTTPLIKFNNNNRHCLDSSIKVILYLLKQISDTRHDLINTEIETLLYKFNNNKIIKNIITDKIVYKFQTA
jgi:abortive infection bacteriophage resistance protein